MQPNNLSPKSVLNIRKWTLTSSKFVGLIRKGCKALLVGMIFNGKHIPINFLTKL